MIYRNPLHRVLGAAEFLKTLKLPTSKPATPSLGHIWEASDVLNFCASTGTKFAVDNTTAFGGDVSGTYNDVSVNKISGVAVSTATPNTGNLLAFNGTAWTPTVAPVSSDYNHNSLSGVMGNAAGYHLDLNGYNAVIGAKAYGASNVFATMSDISAIASGVNWQGNVQDMPTLLALAGTARKDKDVRMVEDKGKAYRFDAQSTEPVSATCFAPDDITPPAAGRWLEFINPNQDHNSLSGLQGGAPNDFQHLTTTQVGYLPTADQKAALVGTGIPSSLNVFVTNDDSRLTDARTPVAHNQAWSTITNTPTTVAGYGITDAVLRSDSRLTDSRNPNGAASGDLSGNYPAPTVAKIQGIAVSATAPVSGQALVFDGTVWAPTGSATSGLSAQKFTGIFQATDWIDNGDGTASISYAHGLALSGGSLPQISVYEVVGGANKLVGGIDFECGPVNAIMTIDSSAKFEGSLHLVYAG